MTRGVDKPPANASGTAEREAARAKVREAMENPPPKPPRRMDAPLAEESFRFRQSPGKPE